MTEMPANVVISYERFLECQARRRRGIIVPLPEPHDHSPTTDTTTSSASDEVLAVQRPVRPAPRAGG